MRLTLLQFVYDGMLLSFRGPVPTDRWRLIAGWHEARSRAWDQSNAFPVWTDLRERVAAESTVRRHVGRGLAEAVSELVFAFTPLPFGDLEDDIVADLTYCCAYELGRGREERLYLEMLAAYTAGGWPCGWSGDYPAGKVCVYWPVEPVPNLEPSTAHERRVACQKRRARERLGIAV